MLLANLGISQHEEKDLNPQDPKAQEILDALSNKAAGYTSFSADFEYTLLNKSEGINETQSGSVTMKGKQKYKLEVAGQEIISDGETVWTFIKEVGELQISDVPEESEEDGDGTDNPTTDNSSKASPRSKKDFSISMEEEEAVEVYVKEAYIPPPKPLIADFNSYGELILEFSRDIRDLLEAQTDEEEVNRRLL